MTNQVVKDETQASILDMENRGEKAKIAFVDARVCGEESLGNECQS